VECRASAVDGQASLVRGLLHASALSAIVWMLLGYFVFSG
jgi:hypothetical protein